MIIKTIYNPGDRVYYMSQNEIQSTIIDGLSKITFSSGNPTKAEAVVYRCANGTEIKESLLFDTKLALISSLTGIEL